MMTSQVVQIARPLTGRICPVRLKELTVLPSGRRGGLIVSAHVSGSSGPGTSPGRGHCFVFLEKTL